MSTRQVLKGALFSRRRLEFCTRHCHYIDHAMSSQRSHHRLHGLHELELAKVAKLGRNGRLSPQQFEEKLKNLLITRNHQRRKDQTQREVKRLEQDADSVPSICIVAVPKQLALLAKISPNTIQLLFGIFGRRQFKNGAFGKLRKEEAILHQKAAPNAGKSAPKAQQLHLFPKSRIRQSRQPLQILHRKTLSLTTIVIICSFVVIIIGTLPSATHQQRATTDMKNFCRSFCTETHWNLAWRELVSSSFLFFDEKLSSRIANLPVSHPQVGLSIHDCSRGLQQLCIHATKLGRSIVRAQMQPCQHVRSPRFLLFQLAHRLPHMRHQQRFARHSHSQVNKTQLVGLSSRVGQLCQQRR